MTRTPTAASGAPAGVTDWLVWPATVAHVRTKLRAAVLRRACRWMAAPLPPDEETRLGALHALDVLDTEAEDRFDRFTRQACERFGVPIATITFVDRDRQWFKSRQGVGYPESPRDQSFCAHAILGPDVMQVPDVLDDPRFADSPAVVGGAARAVLRRRAADHGRWQPRRDVVHRRPPATPARRQPTSTRCATSPTKSSKRSSSGRSAIADTPSFGAAT